MRLEGGPFFAQFTQVSKAKDLKAAAIGQYRPVPVHKRVQSAERSNQFRARPQHQVIGIGENDLRACRAQFLR